MYMQLKPLENVDFFEVFLKNFDNTSILSDFFRKTAASVDIICVIAWLQCLMCIYVWVRVWLVVCVLIYSVRIWKSMGWNSMRNSCKRNKKLRFKRGKNNCKFPVSKPDSTSLQKIWVKV